MYGPQQDDDKKRALQMQAQADQPVYGPRRETAGGIPSLLKKPAMPTLAEGDLAQAAIELASKQQPTNGPSVRFGLPSRRGEPAAKPQLSPDDAKKAEQWAADVAGRASGAAIAAIKLNPDGLPPTATGNEGTSAITPVSAGKQPAPSTDAPWTDTGIGQGDSRIAVREEGGVPTFTNAGANPAAVKGAQPMRAGTGRSTLSDDVPLEQRGSVKNIGNGVGTFSVLGEKGDAARAIATYDRANAIRAGIPRQRELGDNGGKLTVVRDSTRSPTVAALVNERRERADREQQRLDQQTGNDNRRLNNEERRLDGDQRTQQLQAQKTQQELELGNYTLADQQRIAQLKAQLADPALQGKERKAAERAYATLTTAAKDRYLLQDAVIGSDGNGLKYGKVAIDVASGKPVTAGMRTQVSRAEIEETAKARGMSTEEIEQMLRGRGLTVAE